MSRPLSQGHNESDWRPTGSTRKRREPRPEDVVKGQSPTRHLVWIIPVAAGGLLLMLAGGITLGLILYLGARKPAGPEPVAAAEVLAESKAPEPEPGPGAAPAAASDDGIPAKKLQQLKDATVYVKVTGKEADATGSGFLIRVDGATGLVVTNHHVVGAERGFTPQRYELVFRSGTAREQVVPAVVVAADPEQDLAVLKVSARGLPAPLDLTQTAKLRETMTVYTFGFPLGEDLARGRPNPAVTIGKATISSLREDQRGRLQRVQLDGEVNPGNSGGPVVDAEGRLFGVVVSKIVGTRISFAIPPAELRELLKGRAAAAVVRGLRVGGGAAELEVEVPLIDPLHKLQSVELRHVRQDVLKQMPRADGNGNWSDLPGAERAPVRVVGDKAVARLTLRGPEKKTFAWLLQTAYTRPDGKSVATAPVTCEINFAAAGVVRSGGRVTRPWETVTSREGGFTVDMPVKPRLSKSSSHTIAGRTVKSLLLGCTTEDGAYLVFRIDLPVAVPRGVEGQILDAQRNYFAREWHGLVTKEKQVMARGSMGRDFIIAGKPDGIGACTIRVREYLIGKTIFVVAVLSRPGGELPEGAGRFLGSLAIGQERARATGTLEPEPTGTELAGWGLAIDQDKDCKITPGAGGLTVEVPAAMHDLGGPLRKFNAPRVLREVDGDFAVTVKLSGDFKPGPRSTNPRGIPYLAAGFLIWSDSDNFIRLERAALRRGNRVFPQIAFLEQEGGYGGAVHNQPFKDGPCYLRLERKGSRVFGAVSDNGTAWRPLRPIDTVWPSKLKVGLVVISTSSEPFTVKFEQFDLKTKGP